MIKLYERPLRAKGKSWFDGIIMGRIGDGAHASSLSDTIQRIGRGKWECFVKGYKAYLFQDSDTEIPPAIRQYLTEDIVPYMTHVDSIDGFMHDDVVLLNDPEDTIRWLYRSDSNDNVLLVTNQCNSNCIMCPDSESLRRNSLISPLNVLTEWVSLLPKSIRHLCISGGEPTLLREDLFDLLMVCKKSLPGCHFNMLTNGRMFVYRDYVERYVENRPKGMILGIPLHHSVPQFHDSITGVPGSFRQTVMGLRSLHAHGEPIEIRVVVQRRNANELPEIAHFLSTQFPRVIRVNFMALEMLGNALKNMEQVWVNFPKFLDSLSKACRLLIREGIPVQLYNFPLCYLPDALWSLTVKSITDHKIRYASGCSDCQVMELCGGFFPTTLQACQHEVFPIKG